MNDKLGRPTALTPEVHARIVEAVETGATYELAASYGGVSYVTLNNWRNRGQAELDRVANNPRASIRKNEQPFVDFFNAIKNAEGKAAMKWLQMIDDAMPENWQAAAWKLERRYPDDYGRRTELTGKGGGPVEVDVSDARDAIQRRLAGLAAAEDSE
jgi:hypothetical protein